MNKPLAVIILAAGIGSRMKSDQPKVMHELAGLPMIGWLLKSIETLSPEKIITVIGPDMPELERFLTGKSECVVQQDRNGTGGAVAVALQALEGFDGDVLILLGDVPLVSPQTLQNLIAGRAARADIGLSVLGVEAQNPGGYGRLVIGKNGFLDRIVEDKDANDQEKQITLINTGAFCVDGGYLGKWVSKIKNNNAQGEFYITDLPQIAARDKANTAVAIAGAEYEVQGCNTRHDLATLERHLQEQLRDYFIDNGVKMLDPQSVYFHHDSDIASDVLIEPNVFFGPGVKISKGAHIKAFSHLEGVKIGKNAIIGPFARLRPDTEIGEEVRIGNFVEVKKSKIGKRSKINHLAYVGDCIMGEDVNFSAGAITVNYDGFQKHETVIGKGVMVGSNVNLVAPVSIDDGAFLAAGSTITENVPADALSVARDRGLIRQGWAAEYRKKKEAVMNKLKGSDDKKAG